MKLGNIAKNPVTGGSMSLNPGNLGGMILGAAVLMLVFGFGKTVSGMIQSKLPGNLSNYGRPSAPADPYSGMYVHQ